MEKMVLLLTVTLMLGACSGSKTIRAAKKTIKGGWTLNSVTYSEKGTYKVTLLGDATKECFEGSDWVFVPNNNSGDYTLQGTNCSGEARHFVFTIQAVDKETGHYDFLLKPTNEKHKSDTNQGFRLKLSILSDTTMQWQQTVMVEGKPFVISMNFNKNQ